MLTAIKKTTFAIELLLSWTLVCEHQSSTGSETWPDPFIARSVYGLLRMRAADLGAGPKRELL